jgi:hypothetical protein
MGPRTMFRRSFIAASLALLTGMMSDTSAATAAEPIKISFSQLLIFAIFSSMGGMPTIVWQWCTTERNMR